MLGKPMNLVMNAQFLFKMENLFLYIYLTGITMVTEHFSQSLIYDTKKYKKEKELILSMFYRLTEKTFGLTHI